MKAKITVAQYMHLCREMSDNLGLQTSRFLENLEIVFNEANHADIARVPNLFSAELEIILFIGKKTKNLASTSVDFVTLNKYFASNLLFAPALDNLQHLSIINVCVSASGNKSVYLNYTSLPVPAIVVAKPRVTRENEATTDKKRKAKASTSSSEAIIQDTPMSVSNINLCDTSREICSNAYIIAALRESVLDQESKTEVVEYDLKKARLKITEQAREIERLKLQCDVLFASQKGSYLQSSISQSAATKTFYLSAPAVTRLPQIISVSPPPLADLSSTSSLSNTSIELPNIPLLPPFFTAPQQARGLKK